MEETTKKGKPLQKRDFDAVVEYHIKDGDYNLSPERVKACLEACGVAEDVHYWFILHDADIEADGTPKRKHYHIVLRFPTRHTQQSIVRYLGRVLDVPDEAVSVNFAKPLFRRIRYLMHLDELGTKTIYPMERVETNDRQLLTNAYNSDAEEITSDYLVALVMSCDFRAEILGILGVSAYSKYRAIINDLWSEKYAIQQKA